MKKKIAVLLVLTVCVSMFAAGCGKGNARGEVIYEDNPNLIVNENNNVKTPEVSEDNNAEEVQESNKNNAESDVVMPKVVMPMKMGVDTANIEDATLRASFDASAIDPESKTASLALYEMDVYDVVDMTTLAVGDVIIVGDKEYTVDSVNENGEYIEINGGYAASETGMTFVSNDGGTYRTMLSDDYATYSKIGDVVLNISDEFSLVDHMGGEPDNEGVSTDLAGYPEYVSGLDEFGIVFDCANVEVHIVNNELVSVVRYWVP